MLEVTLTVDFRVQRIGTMKMEVPFDMIKENGEIDPNFVYDQFDYDKLELSDEDLLEESSMQSAWS